MNCRACSLGFGNRRFNMNEVTTMKNVGEMVDRSPTRESKKPNVINQIPKEP